MQYPFVVKLALDRWFHKTDCWFHKTVCISIWLEYILWIGTLLQIDFREIYLNCIENKEKEFQPRYTIFDFRIIYNNLFRNTSFFNVLYFLMMVLGCQTFSSVIYQQGVQGTELFKLRTDSVAINSSLLSFYCDFLHLRWVLKEKKIVQQ